MIRRAIWGVFWLICGLLMAWKAGAQAAPAAVGPGTALRIGGGISGFQIDYGERHLGGGVAWVDANPYWRVGIEGEARWLGYHSDNQVTESTYLVGPRVPILQHGAFEPYVKAMAGGARFTFPFGYGNGTYFVVAGGGGVDVNVGRNWQVRAVDFEYQRWPQFTFGVLNPYGVSAGISYRLFRSRTNIER
ncbi:outer membrane beta-barrel protein [Granulicella sibirica]|uniref:Outer membrane protein beta-barrel domain-containing protein n=1 Tax=Granulicella sibirica TaxID=2479048 RepID=A0A4Q0T770_9BACT|nr:outer membrane beta-barrel protein [Granulicella sibirica]RXH57441.1 hypothetical protein GRAN_0751 [Granulicella sibirica]